MDVSEDACFTQCAGTSQKAFNGRGGKVGKERIKISSGQRCTVLEELSESCTKLCRDPFCLLNTKQLPTYVKEKL